MRFERQQRESLHIVMILSYSMCKSEVGFSKIQLTNSPECLATVMRWQSAPAEHQTRLLQLNLPLDLFAVAATEYQFEPAQFDLIVLFYHLDRSLCERVVSALKPGGILICKTSLQWDSDERSAQASTDLLRRNVSSVERNSMASARSRIRLMTLYSSGLSSM
jgi:SAM-dependent methyltransferase